MEELHSNDEKMDSSGDEYELKIDEATETQEKSLDEQNDSKCDDQPMEEELEDEPKETDTSMEEVEAPQEKKSDETKSTESPTRRPNNRRVATALHSAFQKIMRREKRRVFIKSLSKTTVVKIRPPKAILKLPANFYVDYPSDDVDSTKAEFLNLSPFDDKLEKYGTTVKKIKPAKASPNIPMTANEEPVSDNKPSFKPSPDSLLRSAPIPITPADRLGSFQMDKTRDKKFVIYPKTSLKPDLNRNEDRPIKFVRVNKAANVITNAKPAVRSKVLQVNKTFKRPFMTSIVRPRLIQPKTNISQHEISGLKPRLDGVAKSALNPAEAPAASTSGLKPDEVPAASTLGANHVRLQKISNGSYQFVSTNKASQKRIARKFPSPETLSKAIMHDAKKQQTQNTYGGGIKYPTFAEVNRKAYQQQICKPSFKDTHVVRPKSLPSDAPREKTPEPVKYVIPQDLLFSQTEKVKIVAQNLTNLEEKVSLESVGENDLFVIDNEPEEERKPQQEPAPFSKNRRKTTLVPKTDDDEIMFEEQPFQMPLRPQTNIDLIENLAKYRALVSSLLERLSMPQIDFNEDGDEYINMYKIFRA